MCGDVNPQMYGALTPTCLWCKVRGMVVTSWLEEMAHTVHCNAKLRNAEGHKTWLQQLKTSGSDVVLSNSSVSWPPKGFKYTQSLALDPRGTHSLFLVLVPGSPHLWSGSGPVAYSSLWWPSTKLGLPFYFFLQQLLVTKARTLKFTLSQAQNTLLVGLWHVLCNHTELPTELSNDHTSTNRLQLQGSLY